MCCGCISKEHALSHAALKCQKKKQLAGVQMRGLGALAPLLALAEEGPGGAARSEEERRLQRELALQDARLQASASPHPHYLPADT